MTALRFALVTACSAACLGVAYLTPSLIGNLYVAPIVPATPAKPPSSPQVDAASPFTRPTPERLLAVRAGKLPPDIGSFLYGEQFRERPSDQLPRGPQTAIAALAHNVHVPSADNGESAVNVVTPQVHATLAPFGLLAYADTADSLRNDGNPILAAPPAILVDDTGVREAIAAYRSGDFTAAEAAASKTTNPVARAAVDWAAVRLQPRLDRIKGFLVANPDWPAAGVLRRRAEEAVYSDRRPARQVRDFFTPRKPDTPLGKLALARALLNEGATDEANAIIRQVWRESDLNATLETSIRKEFPEALTKADHKYRSDRFAIKESTAASLRAAGYAGADILALAKARESLNEKQIAALSADLKKDQTLLFARIQKLRRDNKFAEAVTLMLSAPRDPVQVISGDEWWIERRLIARKALDLGDAKSAYRIAADHAAASREYRIEAEFHAGWIALRFLKDAVQAQQHFAACAKFAETPISIARAAYWQGRAAEALGHGEEAIVAYETASSHPTAYYGQLARARLGRNDLEIRQPARIAKADDRALAVRVVELLEALDQKDLARPLALEAARNLTDEAQIAALAEVLIKARDAGTTLSIGKIASQRGFTLDEPAFPTFGIPSFEPLARSAEKPMVYAIARQESAFAPTALSTAGAKGLMQMLTSTARTTAQRAGVPFDEARLINDPAFNAQLGAAHLADLLGEYRNSHILTFAAYNAGGKRVREWINAYGDPRNPDVDPVDWIERIPINETRNYVQRIVENLEMYRIRLGEAQHLAIDKTLRHAEARR